MTGPCPKCGEPHQATMTVVLKGQPRDMARCQAHAKGSKRQCRRPANEGRPTCRLHGGTQKIGPANPAFKHGRHATRFWERIGPLLPEGLRGSLEANATDPEYVSLRGELALARTRLEDLIGKLDQDNLEGAVSSLRSLVSTVRESESQETVDKALDALMALADKLAQQEKVWGRILAVSDDVRRLADTERRLMDLAKRYLTAEQLQALLIRLQDILIRNVKDERALMNIGRELEALAAPGGLLGPGPDPDRGDVEP